MKNEPPTSERKTENDNKLVSPQSAKGSLEQETNDQSNQNGMSPSKIEEKVLNEKDYKNCDNKEDVNNHKDEMSKKMELKTADNKDENIVKDELKSNSKQKEESHRKSNELDLKKLSEQQSGTFPKNSSLVPLVERSQIPDTFQEILIVKILTRQEVERT